MMSIITLVAFSVVSTNVLNSGAGFSSLFLNHSILTPMGKQKDGRRSWSGI